MRRPAHIATSLALALASGACASRVAVPDSASTDATDRRTQDQPMTFTFVIDRLDIDPTDNPGVPHTGFDLDDFFSNDIDPGGCTHTDFFSVYDDDQHCANVVNERCASTRGCARGSPDCHGGVDNQLPTLANTIETAANTDIRVTIPASIAHHETVILVRVSNVDDLTRDASVRVALYRAFPRFGDNCDRVVGGREYSIDRAFLTSTGTDIDANARVAFDGTIEAGRLRVSRAPRSTVFDIPFDVPEYRFNLAMRALTFRADITSAGLERGSLGGWVLGDELITPTHYDPTTPVVRGVLGGLIDVQVDGVCDGSGMTPERYGGLAVGFGVHAVPAVISASIPIADSRTAGTCGTPLDDAGQGG